MTIGYLGPAGTFSQQATARLCPGLDSIPLGSIEDVLEAVANGRLAAGVVPLENSTKGAVNATLDALLFDFELSIDALLPLGIHHCLLTKQQTPDRPITKILSHAQSLAQCRKYLHRRFGASNVVLEAVASNGEAARLAAMSHESWAAIGPATACQVYPLRVLDANIQDNPFNETSFIRVTNAPPQPPRHGCRASVGFSTYNKPGELYRMLGILNTHCINMTKIISRPMRHTPGEYVFYVDIEDYCPEDAERALTLVQQTAAFYKFFGAYRVMGGETEGRPV